jgi:hypothetical protein
MDRLAMPARRRSFAGPLQIHTSVHLPVCVLHGIRPQERIGNVTSAQFGRARINCHPFQFEYQQAQLEAEIENLSWKVERAETTDRGDLGNQMDICEKRRTTLLSDFLQT